MDGQTGLIWQKQPSPESLFYDDALAYVRHRNDTRSGGAADWRLPTVKELQGLVHSKSEKERTLPKPFHCSVSEIWTGDRDFSEGGLNVMYVVDIQTGFPYRMLTKPPPDDDSVYLPRHRPKHVLAVRKGG
jgi:hypothetical protein